MNNIRWSSACAAVIALTLLPGETAQATNLLTVYRQASASSPIVVVARAEALCQAEQFGEDIARISLTPRLSAVGSISSDNLDLTGFGTTAIDETHTPAGFSVTLTQPLINGTAWSALKTSRSTTQSYKSALLAVQQDLILQTADAYFSVLRAEALERTVLSRQTLLQKISERAEREHQAGTGDRIAVEEAQGRLTHYPVDLNTLELQGPISDRIEGWVQSAENNQPILEQARQEVQARRYRVDAESCGNWPVVSLNAQYIYGDGIFMPDLVRRESLIGIGASWPLFQDGAVRVSKARALAQAGQYGLEDLEDNVRLDTQRSFLNLENSAAINALLTPATESGNEQ